VYVKTHKNAFILKFFNRKIIMCARNVMQCAYKCTVLKLLNRSVISPQWEVTDLNSTFLTVGECLPAILGLYWSGLLLAKKSGPKIWSVKSR
jgi:hypothetical protein